ncbi:MAG: hypothetical protein H6889_08365 [Brucellaceae bacterium]|nr:hypothetical protein [Brucellaceae bacterium]
MVEKCPECSDPGRKRNRRSGGVFGRQLHLAPFQFERETRLKPQIDESCAFRRVGILLGAAFEANGIEGKQAVFQRELAGKAQFRPWIVRQHRNGECLAFFLWLINARTNREGAAIARRTINKRGTAVGLQRQREFIRLDARA